MLYMVIERFKDRDAVAVYRRFRDQGRMTPEGLEFHGSWVEANCERCFQLMECDDVKLLQVWAAHWRDLVEFEFLPVTPGKDLAAALAPHLDKPPVGTA